MTFGEKLLELRRKHAMSQDVLAEKLDVSRQAVSKWERDEAMPETDKVIRIARLFGVSLDSLLMDQEAAQSSPPQQTSSPPQSAHRTGYGQRVEQLIRHHGYKAGYVPMAIGGFLCVIALMVMILMPNFGSGMFDIAGNLGNNWNGGVYVEGDLPPEVLDDFLGQAGFGSNPGNGLFDGVYDEYQQGINQMQQGWRNSVSTMAALFGIPVMILGLGLIALGIYIVVKGKKIAAEAI